MGEPIVPKLELNIDGNQINLNEFTQQVIAELNFACFKLLKGTPEKETIKNFELQLDMQQKIKESTKIANLRINGKHIGNKPFVQDLIRGFNLGLIKTLQNIPEEPQKIVIRFHLD